MILYPRVTVNTSAILFYVLFVFWKIGECLPSYILSAKLPHI